VTGIKPKSREQELRNALGKAHLPLAVRWLVSRLLDRADHGSATIPDRFQFRRGLDELADWCVLPKSTLRGALRTAEFHGWVIRWRWSAVPGYEPQRVAGGDAAGQPGPRRAAGEADVSGTVDGGADPRLRFDTAEMLCVCGGQGVVTDAVPLGGGLWLVEWTTEHVPGCAGNAVPVRAYLVNRAAWAAGDFTLPGVGYGGRQR
jgi:hypothetical protein